MVGSLEGATLSHWKINQLTKPTWASNIWYFNKW
jgi:hypothetical protein